MTGKLRNIEDKKCPSCGNELKTTYTKKYIIQEGHADNCRFKKMMDRKSLFGSGKWKFK